MEIARKIQSVALVMILLLFAVRANAQHLERILVSTAGNQLDAGNLKMEWSLGESVVNDLKTDNYWLTQGFHQGPDTGSRP